MGVDDYEHVALRVPARPRRVCRAPFGNALVRALERVGGPDALVALRALAAVDADSYATQARAAADRLSAGCASQRPWVEDLGRARPGAALMMCDDVFDDGASILIEFARPDADPHTLGLYIDHNLGGITKDAFVAGPLTEVRARFPGLRELDLGEARARLERALDILDHTLDPPVDKDVDRLRGFMFACARLLPGGASVPDELEESAPEERALLLDDFLSSPEGRQWCGDADAEDVVAMAIEFGADYNHGGPLRWSPAVVDTAVGAVNLFTEAMLNAVADPERWGPAKRFTMAAQAAGIDPTDADALNEFAERYNEKLAA